jgi:hypothetical protein
MNNILSQGRVVKLASRVKLTSLFLNFILKYQKHHGPEATVKWIKAGLVSIQKELGQDRMRSMIVLGIPHNMSLLQNGLPRVIPAECRRKLRKGDVKEIRFWTGLFNIYRVLQIPGKLKLETITGPFTGDPNVLSRYLSKPFSFHPWSYLHGYEKVSFQSLAPTKVFSSRSASASNRVAQEGWLSDIYIMKHHQPHLWSHIQGYLSIVLDPKSSFAKLFNESIKMIERFSQLEGVDFVTKDKGYPYGSSNLLRLKTSVAINADFDEGMGLSQFAIKEEAAGKIRLFALLDSVTQTVLAPLHEVLFSLLRIIPNDGTFDQDESIRRSQLKAKSAGCAYSFDLTAATDRLPAALTANIIGTIVSKDISKEWLAIMTDRNFFFNDKVSQKLGVSIGPYRYAVGQPMGGLSSWAGLAITHHWLVQMASHKAYPTKHGWEINYEILGDDLVIFDRNIADQYLIIMNDLGCEINLNKSIVSHSRPVFEFAKRLCWGDAIVSGISLNQVLAGNSIGARVNNVLAFAKSGLITSLSLLAVTLSKYLFKGKTPSSHLIFTSKDSNRKDRVISLGILATLGSLCNNNIMSLEALMTILQDPKGSKELIGNSTAVPIQASMKLILQVLSGLSQGQVVSADCSQYFSQWKKRESIYKGFHIDFYKFMILSLIDRGTIFAQSFVERMRENCLTLVGSLHYLSDDHGKFFEPVEFEHLHPFIQGMYDELASDDFGYKVFNVHPYADPLEDILKELYSMKDQKSFEEYQQEVDAIEEIYGVLPDDLKPVMKEITLSKVLRIQDELEQLIFKVNPPLVSKPGKFIMESASAIVLAKKAKRMKSNEVKTLIKLGVLTSRS